MKKINRRHNIKKPNIPAFIFGTLWLLIVLAPIYYVVITALKQQSDLYSTHPLWFGKNGVFWGNFRLVMEAGFLNYLKNSVIVTTCAVIPIVVLATMASFPITFSKTRTSNKTRLFFLMGLAIPLQALVVPLYLLEIKIKIYDTLIALILPYISVALPISILIISNSMRDIPKETIEAMRVDGASNWCIFLRLIVPLTKPTLVTVAIYEAVNTWNGFLLPLVLTQSTIHRVVPLSLWNFNSEFETNVPGMIAAVVLSAIPLVIVYATMRKQLIAGLTAGVGK